LEDDLRADFLAPARFDDDLRADDFLALERLADDFLALDFLAPARRVDFLALLFFMAIVMSPELEWSTRRSPGGSWSERPHPERARDRIDTAYYKGACGRRSCMRRATIEKVTRAGGAFAATARRRALVRPAVGAPPVLRLDTTARHYGSTLRLDTIARVGDARI
jgi:hypothetical protein